MKSDASSLIPNTTCGCWDIIRRVWQDGILAEINFVLDAQSFNGFILKAFIGTFRYTHESFSLVK